MAKHRRRQPRQSTGESTHPSRPSFRLRRTVTRAGSLLSGHRCFLVTAALCGLAFTYFVTEGDFHLFAWTHFGEFFDYQAVSLLGGRLDVPPKAIGFEAFVVDGKSYGYFGLTPALLRLPVILLDVAGFGLLAVGQLSRSLMLAYYLVALVASYLILRQGAGMIRGGAGRPGTWATGVFVANVGMGTTLFFLGSRAFAYHEAILCGVALALLSCCWTMRYLAEPDRRWWLGALAFAVLALHARPPAGLFALTAVACSVLSNGAQSVFAMRRETPVSGGHLLPRPFRVHVAILGLTVAAVLSLNATAYLKFGTFDPQPLEYHVLYRNNDRLARVAGKKFHLSNLGFNLDAYVVRPTAVLAPSFPYLYARHLDPAEYPDAKIDHVENMVGLPSAMPGLFVLAVAGCALALVRGRDSRSRIVVPWLAVLPMAVVLFAAIGHSHRYTADFLPFLVWTGAIGLMALDNETGRSRGAVRAVVAVLTLASIATTLALTLNYQGAEVWGVPEETRQNYQNLRHRIDGFFGVEGRP
jgi:hypothetical protein